MTFIGTPQCQTPLGPSTIIEYYYIYISGEVSYRVIEVWLTAISNVTCNLTNEAYGSYSCGFKIANTEISSFSALLALRLSLSSSSLVPRL